MSDMRTEEEQIEAIKGWWKENGKSLVVSIVVALAAVFGWKGWQQKQHNEAEAASISYQNLLDAVVTAVNGGESSDYATSEHLAEQLKSEFGGTEYARFAGLLMAKVAVQQGNFEQAITELDWVIANEPAAAMKDIALLRKARVYRAMGEWQKGIDAAQKVTATEFESPKFELLGDLYVQLGDRAQARDAYAQALAAAENAQGNPLLTMKFEDLQGEG